jgi:hypothetical protein
MSGWSVTIHWLSLCTQQSNSGSSLIVKPLRMDCAKTTYPEKNGILERFFFVEVSGNELGSSQTLVFVWFSTLFSVLQIAIHEKTSVKSVKQEICCYVFVWIFKTHDPFSLVLRKEYFDCPQRESHAVHYI